jgi:hypothetical protein
VPSLFNWTLTSIQSLRSGATGLNYQGTMETAITLGKGNNHNWDYINQGNYFDGTHLVGLNIVNATNMYYYYFEFILTY